MSCKLEPAIWSHDTGQQIPYFDRCQLIITWMSDIKEVHGKPRLHVSVNLLLEYGRHVARLHRRRRRRAYAPASNTASHGTHEKINSWFPFSFLIWVWGSAWRPSAAGAPLLPIFSNCSNFCLCSLVCCLSAYHVELTKVQILLQTINSFPFFFFIFFFFNTYVYLRNHSKKDSICLSVSCV